MLARGVSPGLGCVAQCGTPLVPVPVPRPRWAAVGTVPPARSCLLTALSFYARLCGDRAGFVDSFSPWMLCFFTLARHVKEIVQLFALPEVGEYCDIK